MDFINLAHGSFYMIGAFLRDADTLVGFVSVSGAAGSAAYSGGRRGG